MKAVLQQLKKPRGKKKAEWVDVDKNASVDILGSHVKVQSTNKIDKKGNFRIIINAQLEVC